MSFDTAMYAALWCTIVLVNEQLKPLRFGFVILAPTVYYGEISLRYNVAKQMSFVNFSWVKVQKRIAKKKEFKRPILQARVPGERIRWK